MEDYNLPLYRSWFPFLSTGKIWLNHAAVSPMSQRVRQALDAYLSSCEVDEIDTFPSTLPAAAKLRSNLGKLVGAPSERIAFVGNTSDGLSLLAAGLTWHAGDRIILNDSEFPSNIVPFLNLKRLGVEIDIVKTGPDGITTDRIEKLITPRTRLLSVSFVQFLSGYRADLAAIGELCRRHGIIFCVDGIQGLGASPLDVASMKIDFLACGGPKWLMGILGLGFVFITEELQARVQQAYAGWMSNKNYFGDFLRYRTDFDDTARRYENGTMNLAGIVALCESTRTLLEVGVGAIERHLRRLTDVIIDAADDAECELLTPRMPEARAGIVTFRCSNADELFETLKNEKIFVSLREGMIRVSPHFYNTPDEVERLREELLSHHRSVTA